MYKKKNRMPVIVTGAAVGALILVLLLLSLFTKKKPEEPVEETAKHEVLIYKATGGSLEFPESYLESENDTEVRLSVEEDAMVTFIAKPQAGKIFGGLTINMAKDINQEISYLVNDVKGEDKRINFVMPQGDVLVNMKFVTEEEAQEQTPPADEPEETEAVSEKTQEAPYGLTLHGLTGEILASYDGAFDDIAFLQALGDDLHISSARSEYRTVTDVYFSDEAYDGEKEDGKVYHYIYFNNDPRWRVLSTYFKKERTYMFTEIQEDETENTAADADSNTVGTTAGTASTSAAGSGSTGGYSQGSPVTTTTTFDIMQVSKTFLKYVGDQDRFYEECFQYVLLKGGSGNIVGTMSSYEILPEKEKAKFTITLSTGGVIEGSYNRKKDAYSFGGL